MERVSAAKQEPNLTQLAEEIIKRWGIYIKRNTVKGVLSFIGVAGSVVFHGYTVYCQQAF